MYAVPPATTDTFAGAASVIGVNCSGYLPSVAVHDELVLEVPEGEHEVTELLVREVMEQVTELRVPLTVYTGFGPNWASAK